MLASEMLDSMMNNVDLTSKDMGLKWFKQQKYGDRTIIKLGFTVTIKHMD